MLRPLHDVPGAGEVLGGLGRPPRPTSAVFGGRRRVHRAPRRGADLRVRLIMEGGSFFAGRGISLRQMDHRQRDIHRMGAAETVY